MKGDCMKQCMSYRRMGFFITVMIYKKKNQFDKERVPTWTKTTHVVEKIEHENNNNFYYIT